jgi:tripartite-type tricarboxylate transporter receptor subunit TctC
MLLSRSRCGTALRFFDPRLRPRGFPERPGWNREWPASTWFTCRIAAERPRSPTCLADRVQVFFGPMPSSIEYIKTGKLRALAVTTATRSEALPDIPTVADFVPGYEASTFYGVSAPKNTPPEIVDKLNKEIYSALADPKIMARLADLGGKVLPGSPADFGKVIADETEKWARVIKFAGIKAV